MRKNDSQNELSQKTISDGLLILARIIARLESTTSFEIQNNRILPVKRKMSESAPEKGGMRNAG